MVKSKRAEELALREQNGDERAARQPYKWLASRPHFDGSDVRHKDGQLFFFIPRRIYADGAQGFGQWRGEKTSNLEELYRFILEAFCFISCSIKDGVVEGIGDRQFVTWTTVHAEDDDTEHVGFLMRIIFQVPMTDVTTILEGHLALIDRMCSNAMNKGKPQKMAEHPMHYMKLDRNNYVKMCTMYMGNDDHRSLGYGLLDSNNPFQPFHVFSMQRAIDKMRFAGASREFVHSFEYEMDGHVRFPFNGRYTWWLPESGQLNPFNIVHAYFPHRTKRLGSTYELDLFAADAGFLANVEKLENGVADMDLGADNDSEAEPVVDQANRLIQQNRMRQLYDRLAPSSEMDERNDIDSVRKRCQAIMQKSKREHINSPPEQRAHARREAQKQCLDIFFRDVFNDDDSADAGDALKAVASWYKEFLSTHRNFNMKVDKFSTNLSRFGDMMCAEAATLESAFAINTSHREVISVRLSAMHVYWYSPFHAHTGSPWSTGLR